MIDLMLITMQLMEVFRIDNYLIRFKIVNGEENLFFWNIQISRVRRIIANDSLIPFNRINLDNHHELIPFLN